MHSIEKFKKDRNLLRGHQERFKGDPSFWKTLDNSFDSCKLYYFISLN